MEIQVEVDAQEGEEVSPPLYITMMGLMQILMISSEGYPRLRGPSRTILGGALE